MARTGEVIEVMDIPREVMVEKIYKRRDHPAIAFGVGEE
jgi:hypothetical protein